MALASASLFWLRGGSETETRALGPLPPRRVHATGRVEGWREAEVASKLPGRVLRLQAQEGDEVEAGAKVAQLENLDLQARVRQAAARAQEARAALGRVRTLRAQRVAAASELDAAEAAHASAAAALDEAQAMLDYTTVRAPFRGTVVRRFKEVGEAVTVNAVADPLFRLVDLSRLRVMAEVPEIDIAAIGIGQPTEVVTDAYPDTRFAAQVARIGLAAGRKRLRSDDPRERLDEKVIEVELHLARDARLLSGMTVDVAIDVGDGRDPVSPSTACSQLR